MNRFTLRPPLPGLLPPCPITGAPSHRHRDATPWARIFAALLLAFTGCRPPAPPDDGIQLLLGSLELQPDSTLELRLPWNSEASEGNASIQESPPLVFDPPIAGDFEWTSRRSGVWTPREPFTLGTRYRVWLREDLVSPEGTRLPKRLLRELVTPDLGVSSSETSFWNAQDIPSLPVVTVSLNAPVDPKELLLRARFVNRAHRLSIPARPVDTDETAKPGGRNPSAMPGSQKTWRERFGADRKTRRAAEASGNEPQADPGMLNTYRLVPSIPLTPGADWEFVLEKGLRSPEARRPSQLEYRQRLGDLAPFELLGIEAQSTPAQGRRIEIRFSKALPSTEAAVDFSKWVTLQPVPEGLRFHREWNRLYLTAEFELRQTYTVAMKVGLPSGDSLILAKPWEKVLEFAPMDPNVWFPTFSQDQLAQGARLFPIRTINVNRLRVRAKLLDEHTLVHALRGYRRYTGRITPGAPLDFIGVPGRTVFESELNLVSEVDRMATLDLHWDDILGAQLPGTVFIEAQPANLTNQPWSGLAWNPGPQSILQITDTGVVWKRDRESLLAWVFSHQGGQGLPGVKVRLVGRENEFLGEAMTGADGRARLPLATNAVFLMTQKGKDLHAVELDETAIPLWSFGVGGNLWHWGQDWSVSTNKVFFFTDRTLYRPGEPIYGKGLVRTWTGDHWSIPESSVAKLQLADPRGNVVWQTNLSVGPRGSWNVNVPAPMRPRGSYSFVIQVGSDQIYHSLRVADFRNAPFELAFSPSSSYNPDQDVRIPVRASYLHGEPVEGAKYRWTLESRPTEFTPVGLEGFQFGVPEHATVEKPMTDEAFSDSAPDAPLTTNTAIVLSPFQKIGGTSPHRATLLVEATDLNRHTISKTAEFFLHPSAFYLGFQWKQGEEAVLAPNVPLAFRTVATYHGSGSTNPPTDAIARLSRIEWESVRVQGVGGGVEYQNRPKFQEVERFPLRFGPMPEDHRARDIASPLTTLLAEATFQSVTNPGAYVIEISARDGSGHAVMAASNFQVSGDARIAWNFKNGSRMELVSNRSRYAPGDTAAILVKAPFSGTAWITTEREGVRYSYTTNLTGNAPLVHVPISPTDAPNVFVSVTLVRGVAQSSREHPMPEWRVGYCQLTVDSPEDQLAVDVSAFPARARPGDRVRTQVRVSRPGSSQHAANTPVGGAEVTLFAVDEGVLALSGDTLPDPRAHFGQPRPLSVETGASLAQLFSEDPALQDFHNKGAIGGGGGKAALGHLRTDFRPCAFWAADLVTDAQGEISAEFVLPDSLTRFRIAAVATSGASGFGSGSTSIQVHKPLMLQPNLLEFAHVGDELAASALVFNRSTQALDIVVNLKLDALSSPASNSLAESSSTTSGILQKSVTVPANSSAPVSFRVSLSEAGASRWQWEAVRKDQPESLDRDSIETRLQIREPRALEREVVNVRVRVAETNLFRLFDPRLLEGDNELTLRVSNSPLGELGESIEQLLHYPYGCLEQTSSSLLPWILFTDAKGLLPEKSAGSNQVENAIRDGMQRLWSMQTSSGGLSYWPGSREPMLWGSAYAAVVLAIARERHVPVAEAPFQRLLGYLAQQVNATANGDPSALALSVYALARVGQPDAAAITALRQRLDRLGAEERAWVALATLATGLPLDPELTRTNRVNSKTSARVSQWFPSDGRLAALQLMVATQSNPESADTSQALDRLLQVRQAGQWGTTQANAWALLALFEFDRAASALTSNSPARSNAEFLVASQTWPLNFEDGPEVVRRQFKLPRGSTSTPILLRNPAKNPLFIQATLSARPMGAFKPTAPTFRGLRLVREYATLNAANQVVPSTPWRPGDRILVTLRAAADQTTEWVAIEDPLPAALEFVSRQISVPTSALGTARELLDPDFEEVRGDSVRFFKNLLPKGESAIQYIARVKAAGTVVMPPARIEAMYEPQWHGSSSGEIRSVQE